MPRRAFASQSTGPSRTIIITWLCGGLSFQVEHHLFPKVCHLHSPAHARIVAEVSQKRGLRHRSNVTFRDGIGSHVRHLRTLGA